MKKKRAIELGTAIALALITVTETIEPDPLNDLWLAIAVDWDLNVWWDEGIKKHMAAIYPVAIDNFGYTVTLTQSPIRLYLEVA